MHIRFTQLVFVLLVAAFCRSLDARPNVLFLFADDQRVDSIGALGDGVARTPHLDRLVRRGFVLNNTYCMGSTMGAVCNPSRHMTLSGRALFHYDPKESRNTFAHVMRQAGYETWHLSKRNNTARVYHTAFDHSEYLNDFKERESGHHGKAAADRTVQFLRSEWQRDKPFFVYLGFAGPHDPRVAAKQWLDLYEPTGIPLPTNFMPLHSFDNGDLLVRDERLAPWPRTPKVIRNHLRDYYGCVSSIDHHVGRVISTLQEIGELDNTIIVYSADHGLAMGSHGLLGKQSLYEHSMKSPLIIAGPGIPPGESDALAYLYDIFPTVVDLVGGPVPEGLDGKSLAPVLQGSKASVRDSVFLAYRDAQRAVRHGDWKLIRYPQVDVTQLFNVRDDPAEMHDLAQHPEQASRVVNLMSRLAELQRKFSDTARLKLPDPTPAKVDEAFFAARTQQNARAQRRRKRKAGLPGTPDRVLFLGDSITHAGHYIALIEAVLREQQTETPELVNLGLPSETCSGLSEPDHPFPRPNVHERLDRALERVKPDLVVACYGMNDGIYYPFDNSRFAAFQEGIGLLIEKVNNYGAKLVLLTPPPFDPEPLRRQGKLLPTGAEKYAWFAVYEDYDQDVLAKYSTWLRNQRERVAQVIELRSPVQRYVELRQRTRPNFALSNDGVHLNLEGHRILATALLKAWGYGEMRMPDSDLLALVAEKHNLLHAAWLSHVEHQRPGIKAGLPLDEAQAAADAIEQKIAAMFEKE